MVSMQFRNVLLSLLLVMVAMFVVLVVLLVLSARQAPFP